MIQQVAVILVVLALAVPLPASPLQAEQTHPDLDAGIALVREGDFAAAALTLDALARRLAEQRGSSGLLARTYVYLAVAYVGLSQVERAKTNFLQALKTDEKLELSPSEFPPKFMTFFEETLKETKAGAPTTAEPATGATAGATAVDAGKAASPKSPAVPAVASTTAGVPETKGGGSKKWLLLGAGGVAAVGVGVAASSGGGGGGGEAESAIDIRGNWQIDTFNGERFSISLSGGMDSGTLTGHPSVDQGTYAVSGRSIQFSWTHTFNTSTDRNAFSGTIQDANNMSGNCEDTNCNPFGCATTLGTWTGTRE